MPTKKECQKLHALKRVRERYRGLTSAEYDDIVKLISTQHLTGTKNVTFAGRISNRLTKQIVLYKDVEYLLVYDSERKSIVTFLHNRRKNGLKRTA